MTVQSWEDQKASDMPKATQGRKILTPVTTAPSGDNQTDNLKASCCTHQGWPQQQLLEAWGALPGPPAQEEGPHSQE